mgnify:CR=1 FL=1
MGSRLRIGTHNVNGIRAALRRGFRGFWDATDADVIALQEVRCRVEDLPLEAFHGYHVTLDTGLRAGRNGVAVMTRVRPARVRALDATAYQFGPDLQPEAVPAGHNPGARGNFPLHPPRATD